MKADPSTPTNGEPSAVEVPAVELPVRKNVSKKQFGTQLHASTITRLEWIKKRGYVISKTVDDAVNAWLDSAGVPRPDAKGKMPDA
ncbi:hypothetical protein [Nocardia tenerifensis]|uniref:hypothetical protein n=1 Tax=Nocardia tenerifensis TaxID=228006 RepID=UPI0011B4C367|nr:hypothetical protein [Nocardia tenerifensis]